MLIALTLGQNIEWSAHSCLSVAHGGPLQVFITAGRGSSLHAKPAGFFVPFQTHCKILYLTPCESQAVEHLDQGPARHLPTHFSEVHSWRLLGRSRWSHFSFGSVTLPGRMHCTSRRCSALLNAKHLDSSHVLHSDVIHLGQSLTPHLRIVSGPSKPASSHKLFSTPWLLLCSLTMQCTARI